MAQFDITSPEGETFRITAPENATKEQALDYFKQNYQKTPKSEDQSFLGKATQAIRETPFPERSVTAPLIAGGIGGLTKGVGAATELFAPETGKKISELGKAMTEKAGKASPIRTGAGEILSYAAPYSGALKGVQAARGVAGLAAPATALGRGAEAAAASGLTAAATTPGGAKERATAAAVAAPLGGVTEAAATKLGQQLAKLGNVSESRKLLENVAQKYNIKLTPGEITGNPMLRAADKLFSYMPLTAGQVRKINTANDDEIARTILNAMGSKDRELNAKTLGLAKEALSNQYNRVLENTQIKLDDKFVRMLEKIGLTPDIIPALQGTKANAIVDAYTNKKGQFLTGKDYNEIRSLIGELASSTSNDLQAARLYKIQRIFDDAAERTINKTGGTIEDFIKSRKEAVDNLRALRKQYTVFQDVFDAARHKGITPEGGLSLAKLYDSVNRRRPQALHMDRVGKELLATEELARLQAIKGEPLPASILARSVPLAIGLGGGALSPATAIPTMAGMRAAQAGLYSEPMRRVLTQGVSPDVQTLSPALARALGLGITFPTSQKIGAGSQ
jgi:hypothetical protein